MDEQFEALKASILDAALSSTPKPCTESIMGIKNSQSVSDLIAVAKEHFEECCVRRVLNSNLVKTYVVEMHNQGIYCNEDVKNKYLLVTGEAEVEASGYSLVIALDHANVVARDCTYVIACDNSVIEAWDMTTITARDNAKVVAKDYATVSASNHASVEAQYRSQIIYEDNVVISSSDEAVIFKK